MATMSETSQNGRTFPQFSLLPPEIQLQIWEDACDGPAMHVFDVCLPTEQGRLRGRKAFTSSTISSSPESSSSTAPLPEEAEKRWAKSKRTVFLDAALNGGDNDDASSSSPSTSPTTTCRPSSRSDPSMYKFRNATQLACQGSSTVAHPDILQSASKKDEDGNTAIATAAAETKTVDSYAVNSVYLPGPDRTVHYDNATDVLHLRFGGRDGAALGPSREAIYGGGNEPIMVVGGGSGCTQAQGELDVDTCSKGEEEAQAVQEVRHEEGEEDEENAGLRGVLESIWSAEAAATISAARRIALSVSDTWTEEGDAALAMEEVMHLACVLQKDLEVLYLVVDSGSSSSPNSNSNSDSNSNSASSSTSASASTSTDSEAEDTITPKMTTTTITAPTTTRTRARARDLQTRGGELDLELHGECGDDEMARKADVIRGVGTTYTEVFDLEELGWTAEHPTYVFARILDEAVRSQQGSWASCGGKEVWRGVRVLVAEDEDMA